MSCKCIFNPPPENIEGTVSKQGKLYTRLSRNLIFLHRPRIRRFICSGVGMFLKGLLCMAICDFCYLESIKAVVKVVIETWIFQTWNPYIHSEAASERSDWASIPLQKCPVVLLWYLCGTPVVHVSTTEITTGMRNIPHTFCGNGPRQCVVILWYIQVLKFPVVLVWYTCCTCEYHKNYHRNEKYTTHVLL